MKTVKLFPAILLCLVCTTFFASLISCSGYTMPDEKAKEILREKLPLSKKVLSAIYGDSLKLREPEKIDKSWTTPHYFEIVDDSDYLTAEEIKKDAEAVFSPTYLDIIYEYAFEGNDETMSRFGEKEGRLTVDVTKEPYRILSELDIDSAKVTKSSRYSVEISLSGKDSDGNTAIYTVRLARLGDDWFFSGPTY